MSVSKPSISTSNRLWQNIAKWGKNSPAYIVVHFTGGFSDSTGAMYSIYKSYLSRGSNAHYLVGRDATWELVNPKTYYCTYSCGSKVGKKNACLLDGWGPSAYSGPLSMSHAGVAGHSNTINVEICSCKSGPRRCNPMDDGWYFDTGTYIRAVNLVAWLCDEYGIRVDHIIMHNQVTGKLCPAMWCNAPGAESQFERFRNNVSALLNEVEEDTPVSPSPEPVGGTIDVAADSLFYSRPSIDAPVIWQSQTDEEMDYTLESDGFYYTENGWVLPA